MGWAEVGKAHLDPAHLDHYIIGNYLGFVQPYYRIGFERVAALSQII